MSKESFWEKIFNLIGNPSDRRGNTFHGCGGKKGNPIKVDGKYRVGDRVYFFHRGDRTTGDIYKVYGDSDGNPIYDVQVGGQCPSFRYGMKEAELYLQK